MKRASYALVVAIGVIAGVVLWAVTRPTVDAPVSKKEEGAAVPSPSPVVDDSLPPSRADRSPRPAEGSARPDAGDNREPQWVVDPVEEWAGIALDERGLSLGSKAKFFNRALIADARGNLSGCVSHIKTVNTEVTVELFAESRQGSVVVRHARLNVDAGVDLYARRCIEAAFERSIRLEDLGIPQGQLFHFSYPLIINAEPGDQLQDQQAHSQAP